jgi:hypothetical protein
MLTGTVGYKGSTQATITAIETTDGVRFDIALTGAKERQLAGDIRGLFLDLAKHIAISSSDETAPLDWHEGKPVNGTDRTEAQWGENQVINLGNGAYLLATERTGPLSRQIIR